MIYKIMTRENAKLLLPIIKAYSEGKQIQHFEFGEWIDKEYPNFTDLISFYRIKPEPKYRPFKSVEECWEEIQKHQPFGWIKQKEPTQYFVCILGGLITDFDFRFKNYTFADGTPYGIKEKE